MIQSLRQIKSKIRNIENVEKVTHAMEMIATAKFRSIEGEVFAAVQYVSKIESLLDNLLAHRGSLSHPLIEENKGQQKIALCVIASDTGLCSTYNSNVFDALDLFMKEHASDMIDFIVIGKKGFNYFKRKTLNVVDSFLELHGRYSDELAKKILNTLTDRFVSKSVREIYVVSTHFETTARHRVRIKKLLPVDIRNVDGGKILFEPDIQGIFDELMPAYMFNKIKVILLEAFASEHASRMMAMGEATSNARDLLEDMVLLRNKVRQANITKEILEISSTAEVLR